MRLAYFSPLNPQRSGISDYSEELLPHLAEAGADVTLFVDGFAPTGRDVSGRFECVDYRRDPSRLGGLVRFDAVIYHVGNDHRYHAGIVEAMGNRPGVVVFHDFALQDFFLGLARERGDLRIYLEEVAACHGEETRREAEEALARGGAPACLARPTDFPLNCRLAKRAEAIIVHSEWARSRFERIAPGIPVRRVDMPVGTPAPSHDESRANRTDGPVRLASFGLITPGKGIEMALRALSRLKATHDFRYDLVGEPNPFFDVRELVRRYGMEDRVTITGHVTLAEFERRIAATDVALNVRERTVGETSASLCRIMTAGVAPVVSNVGWYAELPDGAVVKIDLDECADELLLAYLRRLIEDEPLRTRIGENAQRYALAAHDPRKSAADYLDFLREVVAARPRRALVASVGTEVARLGIGAEEEVVLQSIAAEVAVLAPAGSFKTSESRQSGDGQDGNERNGDGRAFGSKEASANGGPAAPSPGRLPKIEGVDYKRAAAEYPRKLDAERSHYLLTKPFYNLANKPPKHAGDGMDAETHRHFCDFANVAAALALPAGSRVLDVGCGSGWLSEYFARLGYDVTGTDLSHDLVEMARERVARVPYGVDHETPLRCRFVAHDIEAGPLAEKFDAVICYDSLHHFEDERAVFRNLAAMLDVGGMLFLLEGEKPPPGSATEEELTEVMRRYQTLESPFSREYLGELLDANGFSVVGDYVSVNGLFERDLLEGDRLPTAGLATDYHYLTCKKVADGSPASCVPDSRLPGTLRARLLPLEPPPAKVAPGSRLELRLSVTNEGDTLWLTGQSLRAGVVTPAVRVRDESGTLVNEFHGQPMLPRAVAPGESLTLKINCPAPTVPGRYELKVDLVDQHVCWFEERGSEPFVLRFEITR